MIKWLKKINKKEYKFDFKTKIGIYFATFLVGSFVGYIYEVLYYLIEDHILVNRGFLYGPYVPVYGTGAVLMLFALKRFKKYPILVFLFAVLLTGVLEYITGVFMYELYHRRWWDYTGLFLNINGYVCFRSVFTFGIGGLLLIYLIDPLICRLAATVKKQKFISITSIGICIVIIDLILTLIFRNKL